MWGLGLPIREWRRQIVFLKRTPDLSEPHPAVIDDIHVQNLRSETGQPILVGPEDANRVEVDPGSYGESIDTDSALEAGCDGLTPDQHAFALQPLGWRETPVGQHMYGELWKRSGLPETRD
jgi:hypothetical protein